MSPSNGGRIRALHQKGRRQPRRHHDNCYYKEVRFTYPEPKLHNRRGETALDQGQASERGFEKLELTLESNETPDSRICSSPI